jgi:hypothetical protein
MLEGLLWFDDGDRTVRQKAAQAVARFRRKYPSAEPAMVYVNPADLATLKPNNRKAQGVEIKPQRETLRHHYFVVAKDEPDISAELSASRAKHIGVKQRGGAATWLVTCLGLILFLAATACVLAYCWMW